MLPRDQAIIRRFYVAAESYAEIAEALNVSVKIVSVALVRAKSRLRRALAEKNIM